MPYPDTPWRARLRPASFRGAAFHVELGGQAGGRRVALHEYPKRDEPYSEDMGRRARRFGVTAYIVGPDYLAGRDALIAACNREGAGTLVLPTFPEQMVICETYNAAERREQGGYVEIELGFLEAGSQAPITITTDTGQQVETKANDAEAAVSTSYKAAATTSPAGVRTVGGVEQMDA